MCKTPVTAASSSSHGPRLLAYRDLLSRLANPPPDPVQDEHAKVLSSLYQRAHSTPGPALLYLYLSSLCHLAAPVRIPGPKLCGSKSAHGNFERAHALHREVLSLSLQNGNPFREDLIQVMQVMCGFQKTKPGRHMMLGGSIVAALRE